MTSPTTSINDSALGSEMGSLDRHQTLNSLSLPHPHNYANNYNSNKQHHHHRNFNDDRTPNMIPTSSELAPLIPKVKTLSSFQNLEPDKPIKRANTTPSKSNRGPPRETTEFICYAMFRVWHRIPPKTDIPPLLFNELVFIMHDLLCKTGVGMSCLLLALLYVARLRNATPDTEPILMGSEFRVFVCALILAQKWLKDDRLSNTYWSRTSTIPTLEINLMERHFLSKINWNLNSSNEEFEKWKKVVKTLGGEHAQRLAKHKREQLNIEKSNLKIDMDLS
ncbi:hypothetical protein HK099_002213 [Clydaea vesicula]|uniref:Cyclin N-terminal domain-containing protein n=1 Tax=Clydaea vesicula TaxID=447962 RepID=A0AAD5TTL8_9FUNG|nr:hypothetical protein HK099_002213 [Clydaea vesicula]